jgi:membrane-bound lytic murein transglycosylase D
MIKKFSGLLLLCCLASCVSAPAPQPTTPPAPDTIINSHTFDEGEQLEAEPETAPTVVELTDSQISQSDNAELAQLTDVWQRIRQQSQLDIPDNAEVRKYRQFYSRYQSFYDDIAQRASPFLYHIVIELEKRQMPVELALLPVIESGFNPLAQAGAPAGLWQMVPQTAKNFGLKRNQWYDGRKDPIASTEATLNYLQHLYDELGQDWLNAVAGYNAGEGKVQQAIRANRRAGKSVHFWSLRIPSRHTSTVPKWLALIDILKNSDRYGIRFAQIPNQPQIGIVTLSGQIELKAAAQLAGMSLAELKKLNPAYRGAFTSASGPHRLVLPVEKMSLFAKQSHHLPQGQHQQATSTWLEDERPKLRDKTAGSYKVRSGDSLSLIAQKHGVTVKKIKQLNNLKSDQLKIGQRLRVSSEVQQPTITANVQQQRKTKAAQSVRSYQIQSGDNLWDLAKKFKVDVIELQKLNQLTAKSALKPGQTLKIPVATATKKANKRSYTVKKGDSLDKIARSHKIKLADLLKWNQLKAGSLLQPGQQLIVLPTQS